jgi:hypothetical protein
MICTHEKQMYHLLDKYQFYQLSQKRKKRKSSASGR